MDATFNYFFRNTLLLLMLLNPFLVILYLIEIIKKLSFFQYSRVLITAGIISIMVFSLFAVIGDYVFASIFQAHFASFQIFGGVIFLIIGLQFVFQGTGAIDILRGELPQIAGAVAMPIMIGPGTISASVVIGENLEPALAILSIVIAVGFSVIVMIILKFFHDKVISRREYLIERYTEIAGRILAIYIGTIAVEMIMKGITTWLSRF
jgi:small neutral amino acid transporter SnatA (MarC family)